MTRERFLVEIDGAEVDDLYPDITQIEVECGEDQPSVFRVEMSVVLGSDGEWSHIDDDRLAPWRQVRVQVGFEDGFEPLISGYITRVDTTVEADPARCRLELFGADVSVLLDRVERLRTWPEKNDSDIATEIFSSYGLSSTVDGTASVHGAVVSTIVQRETDWTFLRRLARRNGFECFVEGRTGYFREPSTMSGMQSTLAVRFGEQTNVAWFAVRVDARSPARINAFQLDRAEKTVLSATAAASQGRPMGADGSAALLPAGLDPAEAYVAMTASTGLGELQPLCQGLFDRADWFVTGEGVLDGNRYGDVLRPHRPVTIKGIGERHSGVYQVTHVMHMLDAGGYAQHFRVKRNALRPTGAEDFGPPAIPGGGS